MKKINNSEIEGKTQNKGGSISEPLKLQTIQELLEALKQQIELNKKLEELKPIFVTCAIAGIVIDIINKSQSKGEN